MSKLIIMQETFDIMVSKDPDIGREIYEKGIVKEIEETGYRYLLIE